MPDPSESQPLVSPTAPLEVATPAPDPFGTASELAGLQEQAIAPILEDTQLYADATSLQNVGNHDLVERAGQGEIEALRQLLNHDLAAYSAKLADIELRGERLQLSISGREVPMQDAVEGLIKEWIVQLRLPQVKKVELYGQKDDCELPFWRSELNPAELELATPRQKPPEIKPVRFAFQTTDSNGSTPSETGANPPEQTVLNGQTDTKMQRSEAVLETVDRQPDMQPEQMEAIAAALDAVQVPILPSLPVELDNEETAARSASETKTDLEPVVPEPKKIIENAETLSKRKVVEAFLAKYAAGERSFIKIDLSEADLSGINLTLADLQESQLIWANLQEASLYHVNLLGAKLRHANLRGAKLRSANLQGADFLNADLSETDLTWSNLTGANLTGANLTDANLKNAILDNVIMPDGTRLD
jgi:Pentapeptide repeats (8 copies)